MKILEKNQQKTNYTPKNFIHQFTRYVEEEIKNKWKNKIAYVLKFFPELKHDKFKVGKTQSAAGVYCKQNPKQPYEYIRLSKNVKLITIAHEFTHILQQRKEIPSGEKQCDIWTLARTHKYLDSPPSYIEIPRKIKRNWNINKTKIHELAKKSIKKRDNGTRFYIKWLEKELRTL